MMLIFTRPQYLILLMAIPLLIFVHIIALKSIKKRAIKFANFEAISKIRGVEIFSKNLTVLYINILIVLLVVFSVSGASLTRNVETSQLSFVIAIDVSGSMIADDIQPSRIEAAKKSATDFLDIVPEKTRIGIISFSGVSSVKQEITDDTSKIASAIQDIDISMIGGTDILNAIITSTNLLRDEDAKTIILISDGQANINSLQDIIDYSNDNKVMIHSLGIGTREGGTDESGVTYTISEDTLKTISYNTDGQYYNIKDLNDFYSSLRDIIRVTKKRTVYDLSFYLMMAALFFLILNFALINTRYRVLP